MPRAKEFIVPGNVSPWTRGTWRLKAGLLDETTEYAYTHGQCHAMAVALNKLTGFEIVGLGRGFWDDTPGHFMVRADYGYLFDVEGLHTEDKAVSRYGIVREFDAAYAWGLATRGEYYPLHLQAAMHFAPLVINKYL